MSSEEIRQTMEFLLQNQARFASRMEKDEECSPRLEAAFVTLVELARSSDERMDTFDEARADFNQQIMALDVRLAEAQARLTEAQARADERLNALIAIVERSFGRANAKDPYTSGRQCAPTR